MTAAPAPRFLRRRCSVGRWIGLASVADATPEELLSQLYDGSGGQFLDPAQHHERNGPANRVPEAGFILQEGTAEQQSLYLDAVQTMAWCSHSFDGAQRRPTTTFWSIPPARLRRPTGRRGKRGGGGDVWKLGGGGIYLGFSGQRRFRGFSGSLATASDSDPSGSSITLQSPDGRCTITAWENSSIVRCEEPGGNRMADGGLHLLCPI